MGSAPKRRGGVQAVVDNRPLGVQRLASGPAEQQSGGRIQGRDGGQLRRGLGPVNELGLKRGPRSQYLPVQPVHPHRPGVESPPDGHGQPDQQHDDAPYRHRHRAGSHGGKSRQRRGCAGGDIDGLCHGRFLITPELSC